MLDDDTVLIVNNNSKSNKLRIVRPFYCIEVVKSSLKTSDLIFDKNELIQIDKQQILAIV